MAALTRVDEVKTLPIGDRVLKVVRATSGAGANAADEWIDTGLSTIDAVVSIQVLGTATGVTSTAVRNARGTGVATGVNPGDLGVEFSAATTLFSATVLGIP